MSKSLEALERLKEETQPNAYTLNHNEEDFNTIKQDLEFLKSLKQIWNNQEFCKGIALSADSLNSLLNYNLDMFNKNLELDTKVLEFENAIEKEIEMLIERRSDAYYAEEYEVYRELDIIIEELKEVL